MAGYSMTLKEPLKNRSEIFSMTPKINLIFACLEREYKVTCQISTLVPFLTQTNYCLTKAIFFDQLSLQFFYKNMIFYFHLFASFKEILKFYKQMMTMITLLTIMLIL